MWLSNCDLLSGVHQVLNIFYLLGVLVLQQNSKMLLCISLEEEPRPFPKQHCCFLAPLPLFPHPLPFLINNSLNLPFGSQGRNKAEAYSLQIRNGGQKNVSASRNPIGSCLISVIFSSLLNPNQKSSSALEIVRIVRGTVR